VAGLAGAVLAGGSGRRLGRDKALVEVAGRPLVARAVAALVDARAAPVVVVGGDPERFAGLHAAGGPIDALPDAPPPDRGPLVGLVTALGASPAWVDAVVAVPVDLARPRAAVVRALATALGGADAAVAVADGRRHPTLAAWAPAAGPRLSAAVAAGARALRDGLAALDRVVEVPLPTPAVADVDTPADLAALAGAAERADGGGLVTGAMPAPIASPAGAPPAGAPERWSVPVPRIDVDELWRRSRPGPVAVVDVRTTHEHAAARIPGARSVPLDTLALAHRQLGPTVPVHVVCAVGTRSPVAVAWLREQGVDAVDVAGGLTAWRAAGHPVATGSAR
jgi:molybdopterin-guanine dinucleotide biosynthesis protein A